ncbi:MAG TPA: hypothetical protein VIW24_02695 [Aldersonia sp.]
MTAILDAEMTTPTPPLDGDVADRRSRFRKLTRETPEDPQAQRAFLAAKMAMLRRSDDLDDETRADAQRMLVRTAGDATFAEADLLPPPGGVGYGMFYNNIFRTRFARGTALYYEIVCPHQPGGNVNTYLYLTATNRAQKGVEAFVSYNGQNDTRFKVFDWARPDQWQTDIRLSDLGAYLRNAVSHGWGLQTLLVWNQSFEIAPGRWRNEVLLHNRAAGRWDLVYRFDYNSTTAEQTSGWVGSWGPIVETFQNSYTRTRWLGFLNTMLIGRDAAGNWGQWSLLGAGDSTVRNDGHGFSPVFLDPNYSFVVRS